MVGTIYEQDYLVEHLQNTVDNLNLLYVAFTRASKSLFVIGKRNAKNTRSALIETVLPHLTLEHSTLDGMEDDKAPITFCYGMPYTDDSEAKPTAKAERQSANVFLQPVTPQPIAVETFKAQTSFRQSNKSRDFIEGDDTTPELSYIKTGSVLHHVFSTIRTTSDIEPALLELQRDGVLYDDEVTREKVTSMLRKRLEHPRVKDWFSSRWTLYNECSIITYDSGAVKKRRPDRVMTDGQETHVVDFKFGNPKAEYHDQVREYMHLLSDMGLPGVKGWLWYVYSNKIEAVEM